MAAMAQPVARPVTLCASDNSLAVMQGSALPGLLGSPVDRIILLNYRDGALSQVPLQIDQRDSEGRFLLDDQAGLLGREDDIVFRLSDRAAQMPVVSLKSVQAPLFEIEVSDPQSGKSGWVYAQLSGTKAKTVNAGSSTKPPVDQNILEYLPETDSVETERYKIGFSRQQPFLVDSFQWALAPGGWSPDVLDVMKIRHQGNMLGFLSFRRTSKDYSSRLTHVKEGPLRVIRRTENRVRIMWKLKTPVLYVDYILMPDGFIMDTIVDIPFNIGLFMSHVETLTTVDWRNDPGLPALTIYSPGTASGLTVDGKMSDEESRFNTISGTRLSIHSTYGSVSLKLDIPEDFAIKPWLYLNDNFDVADPPEHQPGQFGNVGYRTTGWENVDTEVHHIRVTACIKR